MLRPIKLTDSKQKKKVSFSPANSSQVTIYGCGPTVYGLNHVGNARAFFTQDLFVRTLRYFGYGVLYARNYTDIDDKIIQKANAEGVSSQEIASRYRGFFDRDMKDLKISIPDFTPAATETLSEIIEMIQGLQKKNIAYEKSGSVYFRVKSFKTYGELSHRKWDETESDYRIENDPLKEDPLDFALWKASKVGEPSWPSPWGNGRPGWHIECSAMILKHLGVTIDIHMGGLDLLFPHHENELAQSCAHTGKPLANYWAHNGMLEVEKTKMSKSVGNLMTIEDFVRDYGSETLRLMMALVHYRNPMDFSQDSIQRAESLLHKLYRSKEIWSKYPSAELSTSLMIKMEESLADDFNSAKALGFLFSQIRTCFRDQKAEDWALIKSCEPLIHKTLGILELDCTSAISEINQRRRARWDLSDNELSDIENMVSKRESLRSEKKFEEADHIRQELENRNIFIMDGAEGSGWYLKEK